MNKKGFTLIEILAVIVILGIVATVAVVWVSKYVEESREKAYIMNANKNIDNLIAKIAIRDYSFRKTDTTYYIPVKCISKDEKKESLLGSKIEYAYVVVTFDGKKNHFYYTQKDVDDIGIELVKREDLSVKKINYELTVSNLSVGVGTRPLIEIYPDDCTLNNINKINALSFIVE